MTKLSSCKRVVQLLCITFVSTTVSAQDTETDKLNLLPSIVTQNAIEGLLKAKRPDKTKAALELRGLKVDSSNLSKNQREKFKFSSDGQVEVPLFVHNSMIIQFESNVTALDIEDFISSEKLEVVHTYATIGAIQVKVDLSPYFRAELGDANVNQTIMRGLTSAIENFKKDARVKNATPDLLLQDQVQSFQETANLLAATNVTITNPINPTEKIDWGIVDTEADQLWKLPGAGDGAVMGVMDTGFGRHEDITFMGLSTNTPRDNHGNHVAAIACAKHNNRGVRGVIPNCFVRAQAANVFFDSIEGGPVTRFSILFSQILGTLLNFVETQDDVRAFNVSLGYNWRSNFGINPDDPSSAEWRNLVASQGAFLVTVLQRAEQKDKVIFSAAGNDSYELTTPINARYASPLNWAAVSAREENIADNGIIVEAHDDTGKRALFSNSGGNLSCPGVDIYSALAFDSNKGQSNAVYGTMSGTSMASPYCAAGYQLFRLIRPEYTSSQIITCLMSTSDRSNIGTPMLRLKKALDFCPA